MKCRSRSTLGIVVGGLNILAYIFIIIFVIINLIQINSLDIDELRPSEEAEHLKNAIAYNNTIFSIILVVCFVMMIITGLLIIGIVKRRHLLMAPWLVIALIGFIGSCINFVVQFFVVIFSGTPALFIFFIIFLVGVLLMALHGYILYKIYTLYKDIRAERTNKKHSGNVVSEGPISFTNAYTEPPPYLNLNNGKV